MSQDAQVEVEDHVRYSAM